MVDDKLDCGVIKHRTSPYASLVILVKKKDHTWRVCLDYRALNGTTLKYKFPIPLIEELLMNCMVLQFFRRSTCGPRIIK